MPAQVLDMALYDPKEKAEPMVPINFRVPKSVSDLIDGTVRLWRIFAVARGDESRHINASFVVRSLLRSGAQMGFDEFDGMPATEADWVKLEDAVKRRIAQDEKSKRR